jgi:hypothetical protein
MNGLTPAAGIAVYRGGRRIGDHFRSQDTRCEKTGDAVEAPSNVFLILRLPHDP